MYKYTFKSILSLSIIEIKYAPLIYVGCLIYYSSISNSPFFNSNDNISSGIKSFIYISHSSINYFLSSFSYFTIVYVNTNA